VLFPSAIPFGIASELRLFVTPLNSLIGKLNEDYIGDNTVFVRGKYPNRKGVIRSYSAGMKDRIEGR
jgi:hypothetical protein